MAPTYRTLPANVAAARDDAARGFFRRAIKAAGTLPTRFLPYRKPAEARDMPGGRMRRDA